jgi:hypothetical protein
MYQILSSESRRENYVQSGAQASGNSGLSARAD